MDIEDRPGTKSRGTYTEFLERKLALAQPVGLTDIPKLPSGLFAHQQALIRWALQRGRAAIFADTGLGKSRMECAWADAVHGATGRDVLILAPLAVATQTVEEGAAMGIQVNLCRDGSDVRPGINITNYDRLHRFDPGYFGAVVLDESSCIKHHDSRRLAQLIEAFARTPYKLCATATPAPNDWTELGTHAQFLGICTQAEMLAEYFVHDGEQTQDWRLKGHAREAFWRWVASWGAMVRSPADLGFDGSAYMLPALQVHEHVVGGSAAFDLFSRPAQTLSERRDARRESIDARVAACAAVVAAEPKEPWIIWCDLNAEGDALERAIPGAIQVAGADDIDIKEARLSGFARGEYDRLITKSSIAGWGLNLQRCSHMAFVGVTDSFEAYYQAVRRCYRFGQKRPVHVHIFASEAEGSVVANLQRKERDAMAMAEVLGAETANVIRENIMGSSRMTNNYNAHQRIVIPKWLTTEEA